MISLVLVFFFIASTTIGGGYAMIPLIQKEAIYIHKWITETEFIDILAVSQVTPGAIAINSATFIGFKNFGIAGAMAASLGLILPSTILIFFIAPLLKKYEYNKLRINIFSGIRPIVTGLITAAIITMGQGIFVIDKQINYMGLVIFAVAFIILRLLKLRPVYILLTCAVAGVFLCQT